MTSDPITHKLYPELESLKLMFNIHQEPIIDHEVYNFYQGKVIRWHSFTGS